MPYSFLWNNGTAGTHCLTATCIDTFNFTGASATVIIRVTGETK